MVLMQSTMNDRPAAGAALEADGATVRKAAIDLLARREHAYAELQRKLQRRFADSALIDSVLQTLAEEGLQSDSRYAESYARQRIQSGWGPLQLRREMREKGLGEALIDCAFAQLEVDWSALAGEVYRKKFGRSAVRDLKDKAKRLRFMQYRGYAADHLQGLLESEEGDC